MVPQNCSVSHILVVQGVCLCVCVYIYIYIKYAQTQWLG